MIHADQPAVSPVGPLHECVCARSLVSTLLGALTMFVLFTAQTWGFKASDQFAFFADDFSKGFFVFLITLYQPLTFLHTHLRVAVTAWKMEHQLKKVGEIRSVRGRHSTNWTDHKYWEWRSLRILLAATAWIQLPAAPQEQITMSIWTTPTLDVANEIPSASVKSSHPLEIFPQMMLNESSLHEAEGAKGNFSYFLLSGDGKQALLELGFVPSYEQLQYVKSKSGVEIAMVAVQTTGYLLGILERMAGDQRISPIEALATFLGILMILHAVLQWFASSSYKRTLLFHLSPPQSTEWKKRLVAIETTRQSSESWAKYVLLPLIVLTWLLPLVPAIYLAIDFLVPHHRCVICFIPALFFSLNLILFMALYILARMHTSGYPKSVHLLLLAVLPLLYVSSVMIAVIATILEWDHKFNEPTKSWYRWIIPHIGS